MTLYHKNEAADLTPREMKALKSAIEAELQARQPERHVHHIAEIRITCKLVL